MNQHHFSGSSGSTEQQFRVYIPDLLTCRIKDSIDRQ